MKKLFIAITAALTLSASVPAFAGVDFQTLEHARKVHRAADTRLKQVKPQDRGATTPLVLPLDHGPRAQTTPHLNQQHAARFEAQAKLNARS